MIDLNQWVQVLTKPVETIKKHKKVPLGQAFWSVVIAAVIAGVITSLSTLVFLLPSIEFLNIFGLGGFFLGAIFAPIWTIPVYGVIGWLVFSWLVNFLAVNSKKKSNFEDVASLIAMIFPPIGYLS
jgi:ABC-type phosphate transport system permease subunit